jgi:hypothetical protein
MFRSIFYYHPVNSSEDIYTDGTSPNVIDMNQTTRIPLETSNVEKIINKTIMNIRYYSNKFLEKTKIFKECFRTKDNFHMKTTD